MQLFWIYRYREGVHVDDAEDVVILRLGLFPVAQSSQVVAQVHLTCWLYAREDTLFHLRPCTWHGMFWLYLLVHFNRHGHSSINVYKQNDNKKRRSSHCRDERRKAFVVPPQFRSPIYSKERQLSPPWLI